MKILKLKSILFSLMAIIMVAVFLSSCTKENLTEKVVLDEPVTESGDFKMESHMLPPKGFENKTEEEKQFFFDELSDEDAQKLVENYRVFDYLVSVGLDENADKMLDKGELFSELDYSEILSTKQLKEMNDYEVSLIESRGCYYRWVGCYYRPNGWWFWGAWQHNFKKVMRKYCSYNGKYYGYRYYFTTWSCW